jgi:type I restriction enzyme S subunit
MLPLNNVHKSPVIRFKGFSEDWEQRKLGEIMDVTSVKRIHQSDWRTSGVRFLRARDIVSASKGEKPDAPLYIDPETYSAYSKQSGKVSEGDLLVTGVGSVGIPYLIRDSEPIYFKDGNIIWFKNNQLDSKFFYYSFIGQKIQTYIKTTAAGGTVFTYTIKSGKKTPIFYPKKTEQIQIGRLMGNIERAIALHQRQLDQLQKLKQELLRRLFPQHGQRQPQLRLAGFDGDWAQRKLGEIANIVGGGTPSTANSKYWNGDIDWYAPAEIGNQRFIGRSQRQITEEGLKSSSAKILPPGTVLFTSRAGIGNTAILTREAATNQGFQSIVPMKHKLDSYFLFSHTSELKRYGETTGAGSTFLEVSGKQLRKMLIRVPGIFEQQKIGNLFCEVDDTITLHHQKIANLKSLKTSLLQKLFV